MSEESVLEMEKEMAREIGKLRKKVQDFKGTVELQKQIIDSLLEERKDERD